MEISAIIILFCFIKYMHCCGTCFKNPTYVSPWLSMEAQNSQKSELKVRHGLNELPTLVDIQVKPDDGSIHEFIFPGIGSTQRDDDIPIPYGGIVYMYNENHTVLMAPNRNDNSDKGTIIYTGDNIWRGQVKIKSNKALVRVRIWDRCDLPPPDFASKWIDIESNNASGSFMEVPHGIKSEPELVHVRVRLRDGHVTDGIGSSMLPRTVPNDMYWGGVLYAYNNKYVRIWLPGGSSGRIFSATDGWGRTNPVWNKGSLQIRVWKSVFAEKHISQNIAVDDRSTYNENLEAPLPESVNTTVDYFRSMVKPNLGANKGYNFLASGAVENSYLTGTLGGFVYSYSNASARLYHPPFPKVQGGSRASGYLLYVNSCWGNGKYQQMTNKVNIVLQIWKSYTTCPVVITSTETSTYSSTSFTSSSPPSTSPSIPVTSTSSSSSISLTSSSTEFKSSSTPLTTALIANSSSDVTTSDTRLSTPSSSNSIPSTSSSTEFTSSSIPLATTLMANSSSDSTTSATKQTSQSYHLISSSISPGTQNPKTLFSGTFYSKILKSTETQTTVVSSSEIVTRSGIKTAMKQTALSTEPTTSVTSSGLSPLVTGLIAAALCITAIVGISCLVFFIKGNRKRKMQVGDESVAQSKETNDDEVAENKQETQAEEPTILNTEHIETVE